MNRQEKVDILLKEYFIAQAPGEKLLPTADCPSELQLSDYLENRLKADQEKNIIAHLARCQHCLSLLALAQEKGDSNEKPTAEMIARASNIDCDRPHRIIGRYKWQILAAVSFVLSFLARGYFLQFLTLALVFSLKWILNTGSTRTLIMIYEAWRKKDPGKAQSIIRDFQDKIDLRK